MKYFALALLAASFGAQSATYTPDTQKVIDEITARDNEIIKVIADKACGEGNKGCKATITQSIKDRIVINRYVGKMMQLDKDVQKHKNGL